MARTELYTHFLLGDRCLDTFKAFVFAELTDDAVIVHDHYRNYDSARIGALTHQLCLAHVLHDLTGSGRAPPR